MDESCHLLMFSLISPARDIPTLCLECTETSTWQTFSSAGWMVLTHHSYIPHNNGINT